jgi:hypothetical protein
MSKYDKQDQQGKAAFNMCAVSWQNISHQFDNLHCLSISGYPFLGKHPF